MDEANRAKKVVTDAEKLGVPKFMRGMDIQKGTSNLNVLFCAHLFNNCPGLVPTEAELYEAA